MKLITDKSTIRKILSLNKNIPDSFILPLEQIATGKYVKKDGLPKGWSCDDFFTIGNEYPIYEFEGTILAVGNDGVGKKLIPVSWKIKKR